MIDKIKNGFKKVYGNDNDLNFYFAPGRVNLIGEHTDYNGGHVFPCALNLGTYCAVRKRDDNIINLFSGNFPEEKIISMKLSEVKDFKKPSWTNYVKGVICAFAERGYVIKNGMDLYIEGNLPAGSGLSSSASLEVMTGTMLKHEFDFDVSMQEIALMSQVAENKYNGCNCGIMDQFASAMGEKDKAIFLSTGTLEYRAVPLILSDASIVIANTKVKHNLASSDYNKRRNECEAALEILRSIFDINHLCDLDPDAFRRYESRIKDDVVRRRAKHAIFENYRTLQGVNALIEGDLNKFGRLMNESHISLRDDYEVSCRELDILAETAANLPGVIGARMTGGGFGGCTVNIVKNNDIDYFKEVLYETYNKITGIETEFYTVLPGIGATKLEG